MKKAFGLALCGLTVAVLGGCAMAASPLTGAWYTDVKYGNTATGAVSADKVGQSSGMSILGIVALGDASIHAAATSEGISHISHVDQEAMSILGIYAKYTTTVYGN